MTAYRVMMGLTSARSEASPGFSSQAKPRSFVPAGAVPPGVV